MTAATNPVDFVEWLRIVAAFASPLIAAIVAVLVFWLKQATDRRTEERTETRRIFAEYIVAARQLEQAVADDDGKEVMRSFWAMRVHDQQLALLGNDRLKDISDAMLSALFDIFNSREDDSEAGKAARAEKYKLADRVHDTLIAEMRRELKK